MEPIKNATSQKLRGGFYTPAPIADFILKWAFNGSKGQDVLEPSCGDGVFLKSIKNNSFPYNSITAVELDKQEAKKSKKLNLKSTEIISSDFHEFCNKSEKRLDIIVGNPPYIRYQYFDRKGIVIINDIKDFTGQRGLFHGGKACLQSFGVKSVTDIPEKYISWLKDLEYYIELEKYFIISFPFSF